MLSTLDECEADDVSGEEARRRRCVMQVTWSLVAGGSETYALTVASNLDSSQYRVGMCGVDQGGALEQEIQRRQIPYHIMNRRAGIDVRLMARMFMLLRRERVDVIHTHHFNQLFYSLPAALLLGIRVIHTEHSVEAYKKRHLCWALRLMSVCCHRVTAIGADGERVLREKVRIPRHKLQVIRAAVDLTRFDCNRVQARSALGLRLDDRVATIVARLYPEKNHCLLVKAFAQVLAKLPDAKLMIVGEGTEEGSIRQAIQELGIGRQVMMLGVRRDIPVILAATDVSVLCSDREGLPISVLEAMAAANPVVATRVGDLPCVVQDEQTGMLVEPGSPEALAAALVRLLGDPALARRLGQAGRVHVQANYSLEQMVYEHQQLYGASI